MGSILRRAAASSFSPNMLTRISFLTLYVVAALELVDRAALVNAWKDDATPTVYTASGVFPTKAYSSYWNNPTDINAEPQPIIYDPLLVRPYHFLMFILTCFVDRISLTQRSLRIL